MQDFWNKMQKLWAIMIYISVGIIIIGVFMYAFSSKHFNGYYLRNYNGIYKVMINWENAPDETVAKFGDYRLALGFYERIKKIDE